MEVAFISECNTFYNILTKSLSVNYPNLNFFYYQSPEQFAKQVQPTFSYIIIKITSFEKADERIAKIIKDYSNAKIIGLFINSNLKSSEKLLSKFTHVFSDIEIEDKLNMFFHLEFKEQPQHELVNLQIQKNKRRYLYLRPEYSQCLYLIYQLKTAAEIAISMNKSKRTVEKYIVALKEIFEVKRKHDLIEVCSLIIKN